MEAKQDPSHELFQNYARHYTLLVERGRSELVPDDLTRLKRDRLPRWIDEIPRDAKILDAGCALDFLLKVLSRVGFELSKQLLDEARQRLPHTRLIQTDIRI